MQICIDPPNPRYQGLGGGRCKFASTPPTLGISGLGRSMQICMDPPNPRYQGLGGVDANLHGPPNPRYQGLGGVDANLHGPPQP